MLMSRSLLQKVGPGATHAVAGWAQLRTCYPRANAGALFPSPLQHPHQLRSISYSHGGVAALTGARSAPCLTSTSAARRTSFAAAAGLVCAAVHPQTPEPNLPGGSGVAPDDRSPVKPQEPIPKREEGQDGEQRRGEGWDEKEPTGAPHPVAPNSEKGGTPGPMWPDNEGSPGEGLPPIPQPSSFFYGGVVPFRSSKARSTDWALPGGAMPVAPAAAAGQMVAPLPVYGLRRRVAGVTQLAFQGLQPGHPDGPTTPPGPSVLPPPGPGTPDMIPDPDLPGAGDVPPMSAPVPPPPDVSPPDLYPNPPGPSLPGDRNYSEAEALQPGTNLAPWAS